MKFYTHFVRRSNTVYVRGYNDGKRFTERYDYQPTLYLPSQKESKYKTLDGRSVEPINPGTMAECHEFIKKYEDVDNFEIFGSINYPYCLINELYPGKADYDPELIRVCNIDIEVGSENGFPEPEYANEPITAITFKYNKHYYVIGCGEYVNGRDDVTYYWARDERDLCMKFLDLWKQFDFDVITGWNISTFDIPYIVNRFDKILGEEYTKQLSPQRWISSRTVRTHGKELTTYELNGVATLDYLDIYRKFTYSQQESYRLDHIAHVELGENKLDYSEFENLHQLYRLDYQKFIDYNIKDVDLVDRLDQKMKFIEMIYALSYDAKVNINDVFAQVRMWDVLIHNYLMDRNIVVPGKKVSIKDEKYGGAYVKEPQVGSHDWIVSFDLNSLYPHLIMQYNISPDTFVSGKYQQVSVDQLLEGNVKTDPNYCMAANGHFFRRDKQGFLAEMMDKLYSERKEYKKKMIESQKKLEAVNAILRERGLA
jgi:DNA polymerase elongation subunit (family B)